MSKFAGYFSDSNFSGVVAGGEGYLADKEEMLELLKEYNDNATKKTKEFNTNYEQKLNSFNENAVQKTNEFNANSAKKLAEYNENSAKKIIEFDAHAESIEKELDWLKNIQDTAKASGENVYFDNAKNYPLMSLKGEGKSEQYTTIGKQLYNINSIHNKPDSVSVDKDGWITATYDNSTGTSTKYLNIITNNLNIKTSTEYAIISQIKSVSGNGLLYTNSYFSNESIISGQFQSSSSYKFNSLAKDTTKVSVRKSLDSFENIEDSGLRTLVSFAAGESGSITFRISVIEDTTVTAENFVYEPYTGGQPSPNPDYPQEIETIQAYNLLNIVDTENVINGINVSIKNQQITLNGTGTQGKYPWIIITKNNVYFRSTTPSADYIKEIYNSDGIITEGILKTSYLNISGDSTYEMTIDHFNSEGVNVNNYIKNGTKTNLVAVCFYLGNGHTYNNYTIGVQLTKGKTTKPYAPYGCIPYKGVGKNLIDLTKWNASTPVMLKTAGGSASDISSNAFTFTSNGTWSNLYLVFPENYFVENEDITFSAEFLETVSGRTSPVGFIISGSNTAMEANDYVEIARNYQNINYNTLKFISVTANVGVYKYIRIRVWCNSTNTSITSGESVVKVSKLMLEKGSKATAFELPHESTLPIDLQGNELASVGDISDKLLIDRKGNVAIEKNIWKMIIDGTENLYMNYGESLFNFAHKTKQKKPYSKNCISNYYLYDPRESSMNSMVDDTFGLQGNYKGVFFRDTRFADVESFKTHVASLYENGNPIEIYYELATPELISLGTIENPEIFEGANNIVVETNLGNMQVEVEYVEDTRKVFEERLNDLQTQILSIAGGE